jgi:hypothetical protein
MIACKKRLREWNDLSRSCERNDGRRRFLEIRSFAAGRFELTGSNGIVDLPSRTLAGLLAHLACTAPRPQSREKLSELFWGERLRMTSGHPEIVAHMDRRLADSVERPGHGTFSPDLEL